MQARFLCLMIDQAMDSRLKQKSVSLLGVLFQDFTKHSGSLRSILFIRSMSPSWHHKGVDDCQDVNPSVEYEVLLHGFRNVPSAAHASGERHKVSLCNTAKETL